MVSNNNFVKNEKPNKMKREQREQKPAYNGKTWERIDKKRSFQNLTKSESAV